MIADIALISDAPVVLIDEVENAGIDKHLAVESLAGHGKITIIATHDPVLMLSSPSGWSCPWAACAAFTKGTSPKCVAAKNCKHSTMFFSPPGNVCARGNA
jgi:hypothetical protein